VLLHHKSIVLNANNQTVVSRRRLTFGFLSILVQQGCLFILVCCQHERGQMNARTIVTGIVLQTIDKAVKAFIDLTHFQLHFASLKDTL
jgi:hypothetical protein